MSSEKARPKVAVVGTGAVGGYFGGMLLRAGVPVVMIGRPAFVEAVKGAGLHLDTTQFQDTVHPEVSGELSAVAGCDVVLLCVKTTDTGAVSREIARHLSTGTIVVSMQNGVNNVQDIRATSGIDAIAAVVYVAAAVPAPGTIKHGGRGDLVIGPPSERSEEIAALFASANVLCRVSENIEAELWTKFIWNCAFNAISGLGLVTYDQIAQDAEARKIVEAAVYETLAVAHAKGIRPARFDDPAKTIAAAFNITEWMVGTRSSTAQDMVRGKRTEIDALNGYVAKLGAEFGIPTPVNQTLYALVKLQELNIK
ncbi:MAG TPA: ketopantoate reductase family protein [Dongiaceae bacterium]|nr:ketopantoate reductase family protein [Dongiaceae bacterium]